MARGDLSLGRLPVGARIGIGAGLLALVGVAYYVVFYSEVSAKISAAESREMQLRNQLSDARKAEFAFQKDMAELTQRQQRQRELNKVLPTSSEYPAFLSAVQNVANVSGVALTAWSPSTEVPDKFYARIPMKIEVTGRYHQIAKFFYGVGQLDRIINMENISLTDPKIVGEDVMLKVEGLATAFRALETTDSKGGDKRGQARGGK
ncbi:MAG TPA: type 4a pilus biogenesis protein PilO [Polyangiaceae bacterium]|nr:type 4a pilus biogenesis protein PilO [Polyangiaceae bacterium]